MSIDLASLRRPQAIETVSDESILADLKTDLAERHPPSAPYLQLKSEPLVKELETVAFRETILRQRLNDALLSRLLAFSTGADLDHLGAFHGVERIEGEDEERYRYRIALGNKAKSPGGGKYWYEAAAMRADLRVRSARVYRETLLPIIHIAILSTDNGGIPTPDLLAAVSAVVQSPSVCLVNDTIVVEAAVSQATAIVADVWLLPDAASGVLDQIPPAVRAAWEAESGIGFDLEPSWLRARMHLPGVKRIDLVTPAAPVIAADGVAIAIGAITLNFRGVDY